jgi:hypothetical protein
MKVGLRNHQPVCVPPPLPPLITFEPMGEDVREIWYEGAAIQGDHNAVISNPISWTILKRSRL